MSQKSAAPKIVANQTVPEYFHAVVTEAVSRLTVELSQHAEHYLVNLLVEFTERARLRSPESGDLLDEPLAFLLKRAQEANRGARIRQLRRLGDVSLYVSGFFGDSLNRKLVDVDYYIQMGGSAYATVADLMRVRGPGEAFAEVYAEMSEGFASLVDVLAEIAEQQVFNRQSDLLRLYERWIRTGSDRLLSKLRDRGITPVDTGGTRFIQ